MKKNNAKIRCDVVAGGVHEFRLMFDGKEYYLFRQEFRRSVKNYYEGKALTFDRAFACSHAHHDHALIRTMRKLPMYIRYIEKEYGIAVLDRTIRAASDTQKKKSRAAVRPERDDGRAA